MFPTLGHTSFLAHTGGDGRCVHQHDLSIAEAEAERTIPGYRQYEYLAGYFMHEQDDRAWDAIIEKKQNRDESENGERLAGGEDLDPEWFDQRREELSKCRDGMLTRVIGF